MQNESCHTAETSACAVRNIAVLNLGQDAEAIAEVVARITHLTTIVIVILTISDVEASTLDQRRKEVALQTLSRILVVADAESDWDIHTCSVGYVLARWTDDRCLVDTPANRQKIVLGTGSTVKTIWVVALTVRCQASPVAISQLISLHTLHTLIGICPNAVSCLADLAV